MPCVSVSPLNYSLEFTPDLKKFTFEGKENISIQCTRPTNSITLHAAELKIKKCHVEFKGETIRATPKINSKTEELTIKLAKKISGHANLFIDFTGILNDRLLGFYRSKYEINGKTKYLATTQFEAADARRAFPCWDEPQSKATFEISLVVAKNFTAISNMPVKSKQQIGDKIRYEFSQTPTMATYLVYLGVGEFEYLKGKIGKTEVRVITTKGKRSQGKFSLELGKKLLKSYENYFGIKYPLPKLDLIAIPDFAAGAMENWGAITFRETILLYDPKVSSTKTKQFIAEVISHEIAHQWFGNLVTMKWWNDLWLNESFATYMATKFVDKFYPEWELWDQFVEDAMNVAMGLDSLKSSHPIDVKVNSPSEIREIFDAISYDKGGCVLRMLENFVGEKNFRNGLKHYLTKHKYKNATGYDLWDAIGKISKLPVRAMMDSWIKQIGFPVVEVNQKDSLLILSQKRFLLNAKGTHKGLWHVPITIHSDKKDVKKLLTKKSDKIKINSQNGVVINSGRHGFYRVKYDEGMLIDLKMLVDNKSISHIDRWAIQNDLFALCVSGDESLQNYLDFTDAYHDEENYLSSVNVANNLYSLYDRTIGESFNPIIKEYARNYFEKIFNRLGWDPKPKENHTDALLRSFAIHALGKLGNDEVIEESKIRFQKFLKNPSSLRPDLRDTVYSLVALVGDSKMHQKLTLLYNKASTQEEKLRFLGAMCSFNDEKLLLKSLAFSQTPAVRSQNMQLPIIRVANNQAGKKILWPWLKKNWRSLSKKVGHGNPLFNRIVASISLVADESMEKEIRRFFKQNPTPGTERTLEQTLERIQIHSKFLKQLRSEFN